MINIMQHYDTKFSKSLNVKLIYNIYYYFEFLTEIQFNVCCIRSISTGSVYAGVSTGRLASAYIYNSADSSSPLKDCMALSGDTECNDF